MQSIAFVVRGDNPRLERGASLEYSVDNHYWHPIAFFDTGTEALADWQARLAANCALRHYVDRYRILCHTLDAGDDSPRFELANPPARHKPARFDNASARQRLLLAGLNCLAGQQDLFATDGEAPSDD